MDPLLDGFGEGGSCLDDAQAFLDRLAANGEKGAALQQWLESWRAAGGNRATLRLMVSTLLAERSVLQDGAEETTPSAESAGPAPGEAG